MFSVIERKQIDILAQIHTISFTNKQLEKKIKEKG